MNRLALLIICFSCLLSGCDTDDLSSQTASASKMAVDSAQPESSPATNPSNHASSDSGNQPVVLEAPSSRQNTRSAFEGNEQITQWLTAKDPPIDGLSLRSEMTTITSQLASAFPNYPDVLELHARSLALVGDMEQAKGVWSNILEIDANYGYALQGMGSALKLEGDHATARNYLEKAHVALSDNAKLTHELADTLNLLGDSEGSVKLLEKYSQKEPTSTETFVLLGQGLLTLKEFERAKDAFERALELHPDLPRAQQGLGTALVRLGDRQRAKELLDAQKVAREQQSTAVIAPDEKLKMEMRDSAEVYYQAARILTQLGYNADALSLVRRATVHNPSQLAAWRLWMHLEQPQGPSHVLDICQAMVDANPQDPSARFELGLLQMSAGELNDSRSSMETVITLSPADPTGYDGLVRVLLATGDHPQAIAISRQLVELSPAAKSYDLLGQSLAISGQYQAASEAIQQALELEPQNPQYLFAAKQLEELLRQQP